jgi:hypothetical protein
MLLSDKKRQDDVANIHMDADVSQSWRYLDDTCFDFIVFQLENLIKE